MLCAKQGENIHVGREGSNGSLKSPEKSSLRMPGGLEFPWGCQKTRQNSWKTVKSDEEGEKLE